ncbi:MAG: ATPase [Asticcacaulis sp.]|uniref:ATPase n=1 Tax=Asticcacaulis sp. TaxID=1872648 RepID=UPI0039E40B23
MSDKSFVSMEQRACLICGIMFDTGSLLLDKRLRASMERHTTTGWGLCPEHQTLADDGFVALIECDPHRSGSTANERLTPENAYRTGRVAHLRRAVWRDIFNVALADTEACVFVEQAVIDHLEAMTSRPAPDGQEDPPD